jgi:hypothetical protein
MPPVNRNHPRKARSSDSRYTLTEFQREFGDDDIPPESGTDRRNLLARAAFKAAELAREYGSPTSTVRSPSSPQRGCLWPDLRRGTSARRRSPLH